MKLIWPLAMKLYLKLAIKEIIKFFLNWEWNRLKVNLNLRMYRFELKEIKYKSNLIKITFSNETNKPTYIIDPYWQMSLKSKKWRYLWSLIINGYLKSLNLGKNISSMSPKKNIQNNIVAFNTTLRMNIDK